MASQSEGDRLLREHLELLVEAETIHSEHQALMAAQPLDAAQHREHAEKLATHLLRLREHAARMSSARRAERGGIERRKKKSA
jgi:hypothetical protein